MSFNNILLILSFSFKYAYWCFFSAFVLILLKLVWLPSVFMMARDPLERSGFSVEAEVPSLLVTVVLLA